MAHILVLVAHPQLEHSRVSRQLAEAARAAATDGLSVEVRDLYELYPDYLIDAAAEQAALTEPQLVIWLHPIHWYGMPPLMKLWLDEVFAFGWAYGRGGTRLAGRDLWLVTSTGGPEQSYRSDGYNRYFFDSFMPPYDQTAALAGMRFLPPFVLHGAHRADAPTIADHVATFAARLRSYPDWPELDTLEACELREVPADARPVLD
ncbi:NAD(P)H-dependent oxidoreductase [Aquincola sp. S2]|uniref:NAD(P)H-dependent oxidoreductase n=1 Tax=Pseudaquabacterium terrae TaxID=2732868 RepID=A0ABX2EHN8_9BURK|nr:NAD(P)H-dependent oxidoreductase [Aquabacterium terrae]NRF68086.1 NAD(P)H-dependent oxidoreductase [Aquabacterium terrae]